jgi:predicted nucleic acid-binding protein
VWYRYLHEIEKQKSVEYINILISVDYELLSLLRTFHSRDESSTVIILIERSCRDFLCLGIVRASVCCVLF